MNDEKTWFTVFVNTEGSGAAYGPHFFCGEHPSLFDAIKYAVGHERGVASGWHPVAWAAEPTKTYGGAKFMDDLYADSIAAGRLISKLRFGDGENDFDYVPLGLPSPTPTLDKMEAEKEAEPVGDDYDEGDEWRVPSCASTALPPIAGLTRSPDLQHTSHQVAHQHGSAYLVR